MRERGMTISLVETQNLTVFPSSSAEIKPRRLLEAHNLSAVSVNVDAGQEIAPCRMSAKVLYYVIEGSGTLSVEDGRRELRRGSLALVPAGALPSIAAAGPMRVLAVQVA